MTTRIGGINILQLMEDTLNKLVEKKILTEVELKLMVHNSREGAVTAELVVEKKIETGICEACINGPVQWILKDAYGRSKNYKVCSNCLQRLVTYNLMPYQFKNLVANGHKETEFLIHGDFYDEDGVALQPG